MHICFCLPRIYQAYPLITLISLLYYRKGVRPLRMGCIEDSPHALALAQVLSSGLAHWKTQKPQASIRVGRHYVPTAINPGTHAYHLLGHCCNRCGPPTLSHHQGTSPLPNTSHLFLFWGSCFPIEGIIALEGKKVEVKVMASLLLILSDLDLPCDLFATIGFPARFLRILNLNSHYCPHYHIGGSGY